MVSKSANATQRPKGTSLLIKLYLILYNGGQVLGWSYMLYQLINFYVAGIANKSLWEYIGLTVIIFQNAAVFEIVHVCAKFVPSNPIITTFQVLSRVMVVCGVVMATPDAKVSPGLPLALLAWSITEIIRYSYYMLNLLNAVPHLLVWLRYTLFIALYPIGVTGELLCFYWAQRYAANIKVWTVEMPNTWNGTFSYYYFLWLVMIVYVPLFPKMYLHMFAQRKKVLGTSPTTTKKKA